MYNHLLGPSGGSTPGGASGTIQYNNGGVLGGITGSSWDGAGSFVVDTGTVTTNKPINFKQTWNNAATVFTGFQLDVTNTALSLASRLFDFKLGSTSILFYRITDSFITANTSLSVVGNITFVDAGYVQTNTR